MRLLSFKRISCRRFGDDGTTRPIFIIGSPRSGTSILTWCIGQHSNIFASPESDWIGPFSADVGVAYRHGSSRGSQGQLSFFGITESVFFRAFGNAISRLLREHKRNFWRPGEEEALSFPPASCSPQQLVESYSRPKARWVDGTPEYSFFVPGLRKLFPEACFVHIVRDVESVVESLIHFHKIAPRRRYTREEAYRTWLNAVRACLRAEEAYGSRVVVRVRYGQLVEDPAAAMLRILKGVGERMEIGCTEPLASRVNGSPKDGAPADDAPAPEELVAEARRLSDELMSGDYPFLQPSPDGIEELERDLQGRIEERVSLGARLQGSIRLAEKRHAALEERTKWAMKLDGQLQVARDRIKDLEKEVEALRERGARSDELERRVSELGSEAGSLAERVKDLAERLEKANETVRERTAWSLARDKDVEERDRMIRELQKTSEERTAWALARDAEVERLGKRVVELQEESESRTKWALDLDKENKVRDNLILDLRRQLEEANGRASLLEKQLAEAELNAPGPGRKGSGS